MRCTAVHCTCTAVHVHVRLLADVHMFCPDGLELSFCVIISTHVHVLYSTKVHMRSLFDDAVNESHVLNIFREELGVCSAAARSRFLLLLSSGITKAGSKNVPGYANVLALCLRLFS